MWFEWGNCTQGTARTRRRLHCYIPFDSVNKKVKWLTYPSHWNRVFACTIKMHDRSFQNWEVWFIFVNELLYSSCESSNSKVFRHTERVRDEPSCVKFTHWMWHSEMVGDLLKRHNRKWPQVAGPLSEKRFACDNRSIFIEWHSQLLQEQHHINWGQ